MQVPEGERVVLTREERLQRRNAVREHEQKDASVVVETEEQEVAEKSIEAECSGDEKMGESNELVVQEEGEGDDVLINEENDTEVVALHVIDAQPRMIEHAQCEPLKENVLRGQQSSMGGEAR